MIVAFLLGVGLQDQTDKRLLHSPTWIIKDLNKFKKFINAYTSFSAHSQEYRTVQYHKLHWNREPMVLKMEDQDLLQEGMQLTSAEFHDRYLKAGDNLRKVQLINGVVHMPTPVRHDVHDKQNCLMVRLMTLYCSRMRKWDNEIEFAE